MNYYQYKRRVPNQRRGSDYLKPFLFVVLFLALIFGGWKLLSYVFKGDENDQTGQKVLLELESGSAKAKTAASTDWKGIPSNIYLYEGEKVRTQSDGRLTLDFFDNTVARLDKTSEVEFTTMEQEGTSTTVAMTMSEGKLWVNNLDVVGTQDLTVKTTDFEVHADPSSIFAVTAPNSLYVIKGSVKADILENEKIIKTVNVGVSQQLLLTESLITDLGQGLDKQVLFALDESFKTSNWYRWNAQKEDSSLTDPTDETTPEDEVNPEQDPSTTEDDEDQTETPDEEDELDPEDTTNDEEGPATPVITKPGKTNEKVTLSVTEQLISGTVSADTEKVVVNGYELSKYVPGSKTFTYSAKLSLKNLSVGENTFTVTAIDKAGNKSKAAAITLVLPQSVVDKSEDKPTEEPSTPSTSSGDVVITSPNGGNNLKTKETSFVISGTVPAKTTKVLVNGYQLKGYTAGAGTFKYNATVALGTLEVGKVNSFTVKAYDDTSSVIGTASMSIEVEAGAIDTPPAQTETPSGNLGLSITLPTTASNYQTTLNEVVLGGSIDTSVEDLYVNGIKVDSFVPGTGEWKMSVQLKPGDNTYSVYGQKGGVKTNSDSITINYQG